MAASIAKLAIQISTDTAAMSVGLQSAQRQLGDLKNIAQSTNESISSFGNNITGFLTFEKAASIAKQELKFIFDNAVRMQSKIQELSGGDELETWAGQWSRLKDTVGAAFGGKPLDLLTQGLKGFLDEVDRFRSDIGLETWEHYLAGLKKIEDAQKAAKEETKRLAEEKKKADQEAAEAAREAQREMERLQQRADQLSKSVRTDGEKMSDTIREFIELNAAALISQQDLARGINQAGAAFRKQLRDRLEAANKTTGIAEMGTQAELSTISRARNAAAIEREVNTQLQREILRANLQNNNLVTQQLRQPQVKIVAGGF